MQAEERHNCDAQDLPESVLVVQNQSGVGAQPDQCREEKGCAHDDPLAGGKRRIWNEARGGDIRGRKFATAHGGHQGLEGAGEEQVLARIALPDVGAPRRAGAVRIFRRAPVVVVVLIAGTPSGIDTVQDHTEHAPALELIARLLGGFARGASCRHDQQDTVTSRRKDLRVGNRYRRRCVHNDPVKHRRQATEKVLEPAIGNQLSGICWMLSSRDEIEILKRASLYHRQFVGFAA